MLKELRSVLSGEVAHLQAELTAMRGSEGAERAARHLEAGMKRASVTYEALADRMKAHGFEETKASIANKLARATVTAAFFLACLAALELEGVRLEEL